MQFLTRDNSLLKDSISVKWRLRCILVFAERKQQQNRFAWYKQIYIDLCLTCALSGDNIQRIVVCCCVLDSLTPRCRYFLLYFLKISNIFTKISMICIHLRVLNVKILVWKSKKIQKLVKQRNTRRISYMSWWFQNHEYCKTAWVFDFRHKLFGKKITL